MLGLLGIMLWNNELAEHCVDAMLYVTTTYVSLRLGYSFKSGLENVQKIKRQTRSYDEDDDYIDEDYSLGKNLIIFKN